MRFQSLIAVALPALVLAAPTPQDPDYEFPEGVPTEEIVGGSIASSGEFPYIVSLQRSGSHFCGGSLLNANTVITAGHCSVSSVVSPISGLRVRAGSLNRNSGGTLVSVTSVKVHPNYSSGLQDYDVAIWKLATSIPSSSTIGYASLAAANSDPASGSTTTVAGWGALSEGGSSPTSLYKVSVPVVSRASCRTAYGTSAVTDRMFCAGTTAGGKDSCQGDSGGPIIDSSKALVGLVSWGDGCARPNVPGVYSRVGALRPFIDANV
ncbi:trypsin precursor [Clathrospora elynae]|uniref:Trypsin n=1 Tax=Clathrospora elynae TaxID=706981 RepID=A0A6A5T463_9PLEO|nr:trypsin precursor [Clathrospora elynae]